MSYKRYHRYSKKNPVGATKPPFADFNFHDLEAPVLRNQKYADNLYRSGNCKLWSLCKLC